MFTLHKPRILEIIIMRSVQHLKQRVNQNLQNIAFDRLQIAQTVSTRRCIQNRLIFLFYTLPTTTCNGKLTKDSIINCELFPYILSQDNMSIHIINSIVIFLLCCFEFGFVIQMQNFAIFFFFFIYTNFMYKTMHCMEKIRTKVLFLEQFYLLKVANFTLLCLKILIINIVVNNTVNHLYCRFIRYNIHMQIV